LSPAILAEIESAPRVSVSPVSCFELALAYQRGRLTLPLPVREWFALALAGSDVELLEKMSTLLDEIIVTRKARAVEYEEYLKRIADLAKQVAAGQADDTPEALKKSPGLRALYNNLQQNGEPPVRIAEAPNEYIISGDRVLTLALKIDETVKRVRPDDWRGVEPRERVIKQALFGILQDVAEVERIFLIIKAQKEY
jgi:type I restriction enzyme R subunit